ncbi:hypothetical protein C5167_037139 [Papaver somniferum]|uniref:Uncharacterized protein n=1 Tax=Papaver somniferum TaxID=3469 RepID=A0A4Y7I976_PAPSO|nr:hypothetical protein C5167_037139 [Papaver somniferum]
MSLFSLSIMKKKLIAQDSGFCMAADTTCRSKKADGPQRLMRGVGDLEKPKIGGFQHLMVDETNFLSWWRENSGVCQLHCLGSYPRASEALPHQKSSNEFKAHHT